MHRRQHDVSIAMQTGSGSGRSGQAFWCVPALRSGHHASIVRPGKLRTLSSRAIQELLMITTIVRFPLPQGMSPDDVKAAFEHSAPHFKGAAGLIRKYYLLDADRTGGGVYLWESREAAETMYSDAWRQQIAEHFGAAPKIEYFETPLVIDNAAGAAA